MKMANDLSPLPVAGLLPAPFGSAAIGGYAKEKGMEAGRYFAGSPDNKAAKRAEFQARKDQQDEIKAIQMEEEAAALRERITTAEDRRNQGLKKAKDLLDAKAISEAEHAKEVARINEEYQRQDPVHQEYLRKQERAKAIVESSLTPMQRYKRGLAELADLQERGHITARGYTQAAAQLKKEFQALDPATQAFNDQQERAKEIMEQVRTPAEQFRDRVAEINQLARAGHLDWQNYQRAIAAAQEQFKGLKKEMGMGEAGVGKFGLNLSRQNLTSRAEGGMRSPYAYNRMASSQMSLHPLMQELVRLQRETLNFFRTDGMTARWA
jgi:chromosome segregation ATPase